ncbi:MAG: hypothetical protein ABFR75_07305 [Acidobacteriota bacterium]
MEKISGFFDNNGHLNDHFTALTLDYLNDTKNNILPEEIMLHIEICSKCKDKVLDLFSTSLHKDSGVMDQEKLLKLSSENLHESKRKNKYFLRSVAALFFLSIFSALYILVINNNSNFFNITREKREKPADQTKIVQPEIYKKLSSTKKVEIKKVPRRSETGHKINFSNNPNLELMVNSIHRGGMIHIISPEFKLMENKRIIFRWENHIDKKLHLKILNNRNETLHILNTANSSAEFNGKLEPGLYYWKLEDKENLYYVGKFMIGRRPNGQKE